MITFHTGNIFDSKADIIVHQVNCKGIMGSGIAAQIKERFPNVYGEYHRAYRLGTKKLGDCLIVPCEGNVKIANLYGQDDYGKDGKRYTSYEALRKAMASLATLADYKETIAFPYRMSCDRGGGEWGVVLGFIDTIFYDFSVEIWRLQV